MQVDRESLLTQMAIAIADGEDVRRQGGDIRRLAGEALARVESYLGVDIEEAKEIVAKVIEDVP